jgi:indolepyruvate ferredoxin oxidoreductase
MTIEHSTRPSSGDTVDGEGDRRFGKRDGQFFMSGLQATVRAVFDQMRQDRVDGLNTAAFVSGYPGSPVAGFDLELARHRALMDELSVVHVPGVNEELAATAVMGSQTVGTVGDLRVDGIVGFWYGKAPGLERAGDALRHANFWGTTSRSGAVVIVGDDPASKSSSVPSASEQYLTDLGMPILCPGSPDDARNLLLHAVQMSRTSGLYVAIKLVTAVADGTGTVVAAPAEPSEVRRSIAAEGRTATSSFRPPTILEVERELRTDRLDAARRYVSDNGLNEVVQAAGARPTLGIIAPAHTYAELVEALRRLELLVDGVPHPELRLLRARALHPLDPADIRTFTDGLSHVLVIEEKHAFVEQFVVSALYGQPGAPTVSGRRDGSGATLMPLFGALDADTVLEPLRRWLQPRLATVELPTPRVRQPIPLLVPPRTPYFCSGCPHNTSTQVPEGAIVGAGIGCHSIVGFLDTERYGEIASVTQMGGEGAQWIGAAPFTKRTHLFQNMGDGTFFHSGQLAIQAAVAAEVRMTYKLLFNGTVAMTGGQSAPGAQDVVSAVRRLAELGVGRIIITTDDRAKYRRVRLPANTAVWDRRRVIEAQEALSAEPGVTVLLHDQHCAAELRRMRKRRLAPDPPTRVVIAERVCEFCGDCGLKSNCLSVQTVETPLGTKTRIDQSSCNKDYSCLEGDCPSFVTLTPRRPGRRKALPTRKEARSSLPDPTLPEPVPLFTADDFRVRMPGIGGTGVMTVSQILGAAAQLEGLHVAGLDQTGLSQKGGAVVSDLRFSTAPIEGSNRAGDERADLLLIFDEVVGLSPNYLRAARAGHTVAVVSTTAVETGAMIGHPDAAHPNAEALADLLAANTRAEATRSVDAAKVVTQQLGSTQSANVFLLGVAFQIGAVPLRAESLEAAVRANGVSVDTNIQAFRLGRAWAAGEVPFTDGRRPEQAHGTGEAGNRRLAGILSRLELPEDLTTRARFRAEDLVGYQDQDYAEDYLHRVASIAEAERRIGTELSITTAVIDGLYKFMAYKDEYEIARLLLLSSVQQQVANSVKGDYEVSWNLHPPVLRSLGMKRKLRLGPWFTPVFRSLCRLRHLRGTVADPFGRTPVRRTERALLAEYRQLLEEIPRCLTAANAATYRQMAALPAVVRGYEEVKLRNVESYRDQLSSLRADLSHSVTPDVAPC